MTLVFDSSLHILLLVVLGSGELRGLSTYRTRFPLLHLRRCGWAVPRRSASMARRTERLGGRRSWRSQPYVSLDFLVDRQSVDQGIKGAENRSLFAAPWGYIQRIRRSVSLLINKHQC